MNAVAWCVVILISAGLIVKCSESNERDRQARAMREGHFPTQRLPMPEPVFIPVPQPTYAPPPMQEPVMYVACPQCRGTGKKAIGSYDQFTDCGYCNGKGTIIAGQGARNRF
jgi:hypothetical protein